MTMGGTNETTLSGLRMHVSGGKVHIHDDSKKVKFTADTKTFKKEVESVMLEFNSVEGAMVVSGETPGVYIVFIKNGDDVMMSLYQEGSVLDQLKVFLKDC